MEKTKVELTPRDYAVLLYTWQNRIMATRQYHRKFWPEASQKIAIKRLVKLRSAGFLNHVSLSLPGDRTLYSASLDGNRALCQIGLLHENYLTDYPRRPQEFAPTLAHDLDVVDLRIALEASMDSPVWKTDHELRMERRQAGAFTRTPDGVVGYLEQGAPVQAVLEYERVAYRKTKFGVVLRHLRVHYGDRRVLFAARTAARVQTLRLWAGQLGYGQGQSPELRFSSFEAARDRGLDAFLEHPSPA